AAHGPTAAGIALHMRGRCSERAGKEFRRVDLGPRAAAGHVHHRIGTKPPEVGQAEPGARSNKLTLLSLRNPPGSGGAGKRHQRKLERLAFFIGRGAVAFDAEDPRAPLPVATQLAGADEARQVERVGNVSTGWKRGAECGAGPKSGSRSRKM